MVKAITSEKMASIVNRYIDKEHTDAALSVRRHLLIV